jgi:hypothetical protein
MAKVTIVVQDTDEDGGVNVTAEFDPPIKTEHDATPAQIAGVVMIEAAKGQAVDDTIEEDFEN